jgi:hypothetical protein
VRFPGVSVCMTDVGSELKMGPLIKPNISLSVVEVQMKLWSYREVCALAAKNSRSNKGLNVSAVIGLICPHDSYAMCLEFFHHIYCF